MHLFIFIILTAWGTSTLAKGAAETMQSFVWQHRVLIIFAPVSDNDLLNRQNAQLSDAGAGLLERDMVILQARPGQPLAIDGVTRKQSADDFYRYYQVAPGTFRVFLVGKDGTVKLKQASPVTTDALFELIDAMPMRQYEMRHNDD